MSKEQQRAAEFAVHARRLAHVMAKSPHTPIATFATGPLVAEIMRSRAEVRA